MQILRRKAITFLKGIGFQDPHEWSDEKIVRYLKQVPEKLNIDQVPVRLRSFFRMIKETPEIRVVKTKNPTSIDAFGFRKGSYASRVAATLSPEWKDEDTIALSANLSLDQVRSCLYRMVVRGQVERRVLVMYRLKPTPEGAKAEL
jgi:hypothetical protein